MVSVSPFFPVVCTAVLKPVGRVCYEGVAVQYFSSSFSSLERAAMASVLFSLLRIKEVDSFQLHSVLSRRQKSVGIRKGVVGTTLLVHYEKEMQTSMRLSHHILGPRPISQYAHVKNKLLIPSTSLSFTLNRNTKPHGTEPFEVRKVI